MPRIPYRNLAQSNEMEEKLEMSTAEIGLSVRTTNCLEERGIFTVHDLLNCTRADLLSISNFGEKTLEEVYKALERIGFFRAERPTDGATGCDRPVERSPAAERRESIAHA
jgi:DNA-directed RNA polymerase subunit alpha